MKRQLDSSLHEWVKRTSQRNKESDKLSRDNHQDRGSQKGTVENLLFLADEICCRIMEVMPHKDLVTICRGYIPHLYCRDCNTLVPKGLSRCLLCIKYDGKRERVVAKWTPSVGDDFKCDVGITMFLENHLLAQYLKVLVVNYNVNEDWGIELREAPTRYQLEMTNVIQEKNSWVVLICQKGLYSSFHFYLAPDSQVSQRRLDKHWYWTQFNQASKIREIELAD